MSLSSQIVASEARRRKSSSSRRMSITRYSSLSGCYNRRCMSASTICLVGFGAMALILTIVSAFPTAIHKPAMQQLGLVPGRGLYQQQFRMTCRRCLQQHPRIFIGKKALIETVMPPLRSPIHTTTARGSSKQRGMSSLFVATASTNNTDISPATVDDVFYDKDEITALSGAAAAAAGTTLGKHNLNEKDANKLKIKELEFLLQMTPSPRQEAAEDMVSSFDPFEFSKADYNAVRNCYNNHHHKSRPFRPVSFSNGKHSSSTTNKKKPPVAVTLNKNRNINAKSTEKEKINSDDDDDNDSNHTKGLLFFNLDAIWQARLLLIAAAALYGTNFTFVKILDETVPVGISTSLRFAMAVIATLPWLLAPAKSQDTAATSSSIVDSSNALVDDGSTPSSSGSGLQTGRESNIVMGLFRKWGFLAGSQRSASVALASALAGFEVGMWNSVGYVAQAVGLQTTDASKSAFICSLAVVIVPILDFLTGKKMLPREVVGAAMAVAGVGLLELGGSEALESLSSGDIASLIQPIAFGLGFWRMEHGMRRFPNEAARLTAAQLLAIFLASIMYCLACPLNGGEAIPTMTQVVDVATNPMIFGALFWTGIITTALTVYMETLALKTLSAAETTLIFATEPLWGAAFASVVVGERLGLGAAIGAALILGGCIFSNTGLSWLIGKTDEIEEETLSETNLTPSEDDDDVSEVVSSSLVGSGLAGAANGMIKTLQDAGLDDVTSDVSSAGLDTTTAAAAKDAIISTIENISS